MRCAFASDKSHIAGPSHHDSSRTVDFGGQNHCATHPILTLQYSNLCWVQSTQKLTITHLSEVYTAGNDYCHHDYTMLRPSLPLCCLLSSGLAVTRNYLITIYLADIKTNSVLVTKTPSYNQELCHGNIKRYWTRMKKKG
jgi:hypothetical protein